VITVGGTNGKGSTCAMLESILHCAGYRTGLYTSPHLLRYNERVRIDAVEAGDAALLEAFDAVEDARGDTALTYFEFGTLAALWMFARAGLDALILEVGLGGRLDAVNAVDPDVAVLTSVDLDHMDYLGATREAIGREKAGIFRAGRPAVIGEPRVPASVLEHAGTLGAKVLRIGHDFGFTSEGTQWSYRGPGGARYGLPFPALRGGYQLGNAATVLTALDALRERLPVAAGALRDGLLRVELPGRFQVLAGRPTVVLDVAHNPHAARALAEGLGAMGFHPETNVVFAMYADKDIAGVAAAMKARVDRWFVAPLPGPRGAGVERIATALVSAGVAAAAIRRHASVDEAYRAAGEAAGETDRIVVFGSFLTVAAALAAGRPTARPAP
jgi:dihydrofolate synthase / folylpolyglutamate synthase